MIGSYVSNDVLQIWFLNVLPVAKKILAQFPILDSIFDNFKAYENITYRKEKNIVLLLCLPSIGNDEPDKNKLNKLSNIENAIKNFGILEMSAAKKNDCLSKLKSLNYIDGLTKVTELEVAQLMADKFGASSVELFPQLTNGRFSDVLLRFEDNEIFFEIGNLGKRLPESIIGKILTVVAEYFGRKNDEMGYVGMFVNSANFVFDETGRINEKSSIEKIIKEIEMLAIEKLEGFSGSIRFSEIMYAVTNRDVFERIRKIVPSFSSKEAELLENPQIKKWLECFDNSNLKKVEVIQSIIFGKTNKIGTLVEVKTRDFFPSKATLADRSSFLNQIVRHVGYQLNEKQIETGKPNVILIKGFHWTVFGMGVCLDAIKDLGEKINDFFKKIKETSLSGVAIYGNDINEVYFFENPFSDEKSKLEKSVISKLGFKYVCC